MRRILSTLITGAKGRPRGPRRAADRDEGDARAPHKASDGNGNVFLTGTATVYDHGGQHARNTPVVDAIMTSPAITHRAASHLFRSGRTTCSTDQPWLGRAGEEDGRGHVQHVPEGSGSGLGSGETRRRVCCVEGGARLVLVRALFVLDRVACLQLDGALLVTSLAVVNVADHHVGRSLPLEV